MLTTALRDCLSLPSSQTTPLFAHKKLLYRHFPMNLKQNCVHTERYKHSLGVNMMALVVSFKRTLQILDVLLMLLIIAGDVETNPGPFHKLKLANLYEELRELTNPIPFGKELDIPQPELDRIQDNDPNGRCTHFE